MILADFQPVGYNPGMSERLHLESSPDQPLPELPPLAELNCCPPNFELAKKVVRTYEPENIPVTPKQARGILEIYYRPNGPKSILASGLSPHMQAYLVWALATLSVQGMENRHRSDPKRLDRKRGSSKSTERSHY